MEYIVALALVSLMLLLYLTVRPKTLKHIPGPDSGHAVFGHARLIAPNTFHRTLTDWSKKYGPVYKIRLLHQSFIVITGQKALHEMLVKKGVETGGRNMNFRLSYVFQETGIVNNPTPDAKWRSLRKISQKHLKQFGDGMSRLEQLIASVGDEMLDKFFQTQGAPCDPYQTLLITVMKSMSFLLTGQRATDNDPIIDLFQKFSNLAEHILTLGNRSVRIYDLFPWLRFLGLKSWQSVEALRETRQQLWERIRQVAKDHPENDSLATLLLSHVSLGDSAGPSKLREGDASVTCTNLLFAGIATTTNTAYALINLLAHTPSVQETIYKEGCRVLPDGTLVTLQNKPQMHYTAATILEALRYVTTAPVGVGHRCITDVEISGHFIPKDTRIFTNLWGLHHDPDVWGDPERFRPERFLDNDGHLVPADHIYRKNLLPFGAGTRVCVGESLALARLFIWIARLIQRFRRTPAEGNNPTLTNVDNYVLSALLTSKPYEVNFVERT